MRHFEPEVISQTQMGRPMEETLVREPRLWIPHKQPLGPVAIDWNHPSTIGLKGFWLLRNVIPAAISLIDGESPVIVSGGPTVSTEIDGLAILFNSGSSTGISLVDRNSGAFDLAVYKGMTCDLHMNSSATTGTMFGQFSDGVGERPFRVDMATGPVVRTSVNNNTNLISSGMSLNTWLTVSSRWTPSTELALFFDGVSVATDTVSVPATLDATTVTPWIGRRSGVGGDHFDGRISYCRIWDRVLSDEEILSLAIDPYQFLIPL